MALDKAIDSAQLDADLTAVANAIRAKGGTSGALTFPDGFVDAVGAIQTGGGGGNAIQIGKNSPVSFLNLFYALENGTAVTGTFTLASYLTSTETLLFSTGLESINGVFIIDTDWQYGERASAEFTVFSIWIPIDDSNYFSFYRNNTGTTNSTNTSTTPTVARGTSRLDNGDFYITSNFNVNANYTPFEKNHNILWIAW